MLFTWMVSICLCFHKWGNIFTIVFVKPWHYIYWTPSSSLSNQTLTWYMSSLYLYNEIPASSSIFLASPPSWNIYTSFLKYLSWTPSFEWDKFILNSFLWMSLDSCLVKWNITTCKIFSLNTDWLKYWISSTCLEMVKIFCSKFCVDVDVPGDEVWKLDCSQAAPGFKLAQIQLQIQMQI